MFGISFKPRAPEPPPEPTISRLELFRAMRDEAQNGGQLPPAVAQFRATQLKEIGKPAPPVLTAEELQMRRWEAEARAEVEALFAPAID